MRLTEEWVEGKPPAWITAFKSKLLPYNKTEVNGFANCPAAADTPAAIKTYSHSTNQAFFTFTSFSKSKTHKITQ